MRGGEEGRGGEKGRREGEEGRGGGKMRKEREEGERSQYKYSKCQLVLTHSVDK